ncbi:sensor histidine kinase [Cohnella soli]|uniref:Sensor histidine kinase n=1 Tax=Cohnella soli TaxID=425005 RepID=A0ABW0I0Q4_9BACL
MKLQVGGKARWYVYQKIVMLFVVFLVPLIALNIWVNYRGMTFLKDKILDSATASASSYAMQLDKEMYFVRSQQLRFMNEQELQKLSFRGGKLEKYDEVELIEQVRARLSPLVDTSDTIVNAGVFVESIGKTISAESAVTDVPNREYDLIAALLKRSSPSSFYEAGDRIFFIESQNNGSIVSYIEISKAKLIEGLRQVTSLYKESEVFLGSPELGSVLSTTQDGQSAQLETSLIPDQQINDKVTPEWKTIDGTKYFITHHAVGALNLSLTMYVNQSELIRPISKFNVSFYILFGIATVILVLYAFSVHVMIHRPLSNLVKAFRIIETDNLNLVIESKRNDEFHYLYQSFNRMVNRLKVSIEENYEQKISLQHSELKQLQSQINPHFLYNSFFNIYMLCKMDDSESAGELSQRLGSYYQYITRNGADEVLLEKEYQHALDYCEIQCIRFSNRISYTYTEVPDSLKKIHVPKLIIQPIVENVFDYAFEDETRTGKVFIGVSQDEDCVKITVEDNGQLLTEERLNQLKERLANKHRQGETTGLFNVHNRLALKYGAGSGVFVSRSVHGGLKAELIIHLDKKGV